MNKYTLGVGLVLLVCCLLYCYVVEGAPANELIWHAVKMVFSSWTGGCCGAVVCGLLSHGLFC